MMIRVLLPLEKERLISVLRPRRGNAREFLHPTQDLQLPRNPSGDQVGSMVRPLYLFRFRVLIDLGPKFLILLRSVQFLLDPILRPFDHIRNQRPVVMRLLGRSGCGLNQNRK
jgi:hypothetical protein